MVAIRLETTDLLGVPISSTSPGDDFLLAAWLSDQRPQADPAGVYAAYLDVTYDDDLVSLVMSEGNELGFDIQFGAEYQNGVSGNPLLAGLLDEVGAFQTGFEPLGTGEVLLFQTRFSTGEVTLGDDHFEGVLEDSAPVVFDVLANDLIPGGIALFSGDPADVSPLHDVVLFRPASVVPDDALQVVPAALEMLGKDAAVIESVGVPSAGGKVWIANDGRHLVYEPAPDFFGSETVTYTLGGRTAEVIVVVEPQSDAPVATDDIYGTLLDELLTIDAMRGVLANDHDADGDVLVAHVVQQPTAGTVTLQPDGSFEYLPSAGFRGRDSFTYVADDATEFSAETTVRIDVGTPVVQFRLEVTDADGVVVDRVKASQSVLLRAWVKDLRDEYYPDRGVFSAYLDVLFDSELLQPFVDVNLPHGFEIQFGADFSTPGSGDVSEPGLVNEVGSFTASFESLGDQEVLLFEMPLEAVSPLVADDEFDVSFQTTSNQLDVLENDSTFVWKTDVVAEGADDTPAHDVLMSDPPEPVVSDQIVFESTSLEVTNLPDLVVVEASEPTAGGTVVVSSDGTHVVYSPLPDFVGVDSFTYTVEDRNGRRAEATVFVDVVPSWQNIRSPFDVNADTYISPVDALLVIYDLNHGRSRVLEEAPSGPPFVDVNGDGVLSPVDALIVISVLNGSYAPGEGGAEGESLTATTVESKSGSFESLGDVRPESLLVSPFPAPTGSRNTGPAVERIAHLLRLPRPVADRAAQELLPGLRAKLDWLFSRWDDEWVMSRVELALEDLLQASSSVP